MVRLIFFYATAVFITSAFDFADAFANVLPADQCEFKNTASATGLAALLYF